MLLGFLAVGIFALDRIYDFATRDMNSLELRSGCLCDKKVSNYLLTLEVHLEAIQGFGVWTILTVDPSKVPALMPVSLYAERV